MKEILRNILIFIGGLAAGSIIGTILGTICSMIYAATSPERFMEASEDLYDCIM